MKKMVFTVLAILVGFLLYFLLVGTNNVPSENVINQDLASELQIFSPAEQAAVNYLSQELNLTNEQKDTIELINSAQQTWPNGCLGLASPDEFCTNALVEGFEIELEYNDQKYTVRTDEDGSIVRAE